MTRGNSYLLVQLFLIFHVNSLIGQVTLPDTNHTFAWDIEELLSEVIDSNSIQALQEANILADFSAEDLGEYNILFKSGKNKIAKKSNSKLRKYIPKIGIAMDQRAIRKYNQDGSTPWLNLSYVNLNASTLVEKIPVNINITGALIDDKFNWNLSGFNFDFNQRKFLEGMVKDKAQTPLSTNVDEFKAIKSGSVKGIFSQRLPNPDIPNNPFDSKSVDLLKNELKFKLLKFIVNHPKFREVMEKGQAKKDSLSASNTARYSSERDSVLRKKEEINKAVNHKKDSLSAKIDEKRSRVDSIQQTGNEYIDKLPVRNFDNPETLRKELFNNIVKDYKSSWEERKKYYGDSLAKFKKRFFKDKPADNLESLPIDSLKKKVNQLDGVKRGHKLLTAFNKISIGQALISDHWFLSENLNLTGASIGFETKNYKISAAAGAQRFDYSILPLLGFALPKQLPNRKFLYASVEYGKEDSYSLRFSNLNSKESLNDFSTGIPIARDNNVFLLSGSLPVGGGLELLLDLAYSRTKGRFQPIVEADPSSKTNNAAGEVKLAYQIPKTNFNLNAGTFFVGDNYLSIGNPFIRNGQKGLTVGLMGMLFNRLSINANVRKGITTDTEQEELTRDDLAFNGSVALNLTKNISISASAFPNYSNYQLNESLAVNASLWATSFDLQYSISGSKINALNSLSYTNSVNELVLQDSVDLSNYDGLIYFGNLNFSNGLGFEVLAMGWSDQGLRNGGINNSSLQASVLVTRDKFNFHTGLIYGSEFKSCDECTTAKTYGMSAGFDWQLFKRLKIGFDSRLPLTTPKVQHSQSRIQEYISTNMSYKF